MTTKVRLFLKAFAVVRFLVSKHRIVVPKISNTVRSVYYGQKSVREIVDDTIPIIRQSLRIDIKSPKIRKKLKWFALSLASLGFVTYEYKSHYTPVPITGRYHFAILPRSYELKYQESFVTGFKDKCSVEKDGVKQTLVLPDTDERVVFIKSLVQKLQEACIYFSPECEEYMNEMKVMVVEDDEVNAISTMGAILVINTGVIDYFNRLKKEGMISNPEECIAGVLAHELAHTLSRHSVETMLYWTGFAYYAYIALVPDLFLIPSVKGMLDRTMSRKKEYEADYQALFLLKRAGYDPTSMIATLSLLPDTDEEDPELLSKLKEKIAHHPRNVNRITHLQNKILNFDKEYMFFNEEEQLVNPVNHYDYVLSFAKRTIASV